MFDTHLTKWRLTPAGKPIITATGALLPVLREDGTTAMLKRVADAEEKIGAGLLDWWSGIAAARIYEADSDAILMEKATGKKSLTRMSQAGKDDAACRVLVDVARRLHAPRPLPPHNLVPLKTRFSALLSPRFAADSLSDLAQREAIDLLETQQDERPLHGDLHHANVLDFGSRGFLAIDPKGLKGERGFDYANIFCNPDCDDPHLRIARNPARFASRLDLVSTAAELEPLRLLRWIIAWSGLSAIWFQQTDNPRAAVPLEIARLALKMKNEISQ